MSAASTAFETARSYAEHGIAVFPTYTVIDGRCSCGDERCSSPGKHPRTGDGFKSATNDERTLLTWNARWPDANWAAVCGEKLSVIDIDAKHGADPNEVIAEHELDGPLVWTGETPDGPRGAHVYVAGGIPTGDTPIPGVEIRGVGAYVLVPGSRHHSGVAYEWANGARPWTTSLPPIPDRLKPARRAPGHAEPVGERIPKGEQHKTLVSLAGSMRRRGMGADEIYAALQVTNRTRLEEPAPDEHIRKIAASVAQYPAADAVHDAGNDTGEHAGSLRRRLADSHVDLVAYVEGGIPEREWLPASPRMFARGARHHIAAPLKSGKSLALLVHAVDVVHAGGRVAIFDRENGADEYARRLRDVLNDRPPSTSDSVRERLRYHAWPALKLTDGAELAREFAGVDLAIFDSTRTFLSSLSLTEDSSDDFARFAEGLIDPLFRGGTATIQLDNTGHGDAGRARGSSSKGDLADVLYSLKTVAGFDESRRGRVRLVRQRSRFGDVAEAFGLELGAGHFGHFALDGEAHKGAFRPTELMHRISTLLEAEPGLSKRAVRQAVKGTKNDAKDLALELLVAEGYVRAEIDGRSTRHYIEQPFDTTKTDRARPCPDRARHGGVPTVPAVPHPEGGTRNGHAPWHTSENGDRARHGQTTEQAA